MAVCRLWIYNYPVKTNICFILQTKHGTNAHKRSINSIKASYIKLQFLHKKFVLK